MSPKLKNLFLTLSALFCCVYTYAQTSDDPPPPSAPPPVGLPIDDYIPLLLVAGILLGVWIKTRIASKTEGS